MKEHLLHVNAEERQKDIDFGVRYLENDELLYYEVHIEDGLFKWKRDSHLVDTQDMTAHGKPGYAGYVVHEDGKMYLFNHTKSEDKICHSSMSSGKPVLGAGEIVIKKGSPSVINTYSGHYKPSLLSVKRILDIFQIKKIDISKTQVESFVDPSKFLKKIKSVRRDFTNDTKLRRHFFLHFGGSERYYTPAKVISKSLSDIHNSKIQRSTSKFNEQEQSMLTKWFLKLDALFSSKDKFGLTEKRNILRKIASTTLKGLNKEEISWEDKVKKVDELLQKNQELSTNHGEKKDSGRLHKELSKYKDELRKLKERSENPYKVELEETSSEHNEMQKIF